MISHKRICHSCIGETYVKDYIKKNGDSKGKCTYCFSRKKNVMLDVVAQMVDHLFRNYYGVESEDTWDGSSYKEGDVASQIIFDELEINTEGIEDDIFEILKESYDSVRPDEYVMYDDDFRYIEINYESGELDIAWDKMLKSLKSESRFFNENVKNFLEELFFDIETFIDKNGKSIISIIPEDSTFYRARVFESQDTAEDALKKPEKEFGPPPSVIARSGRMNASGIPVFYGASSPDIAIAEVRPAVGSIVIVAPFSTMRAVTALNISAMELISSSGLSKFNPDTILRKEKTSFLRTLSKKLTIPVLGKNPDSEYLITQAVAEYLSFSKKIKLDGLTFESTQVNMKRKGKAEHYNIVLFNKSSKVFQGEGNGIKYEVSLWDFVEDDFYEFSPTIRPIEYYKKKQPNFFNQQTSQHYNSILKLKNDGMLFHKITGVVFQTKTTPIQLGAAIVKEEIEDDDGFDF